MTQEHSLDKSHSRRSTGGVRLKDIAIDMGLSAVTISKALRNHPDIAESTRQRILERLDELGYRPNFAARALITGRTSTIGLVVPDLLHPFFAQVAKAISATIRDQGFGLFISSSEEDSTLERQEIDHLIARRVDALLVASAQQLPSSLRGIEKAGIPLVLVDRRFTGMKAHFVGVNDVEVGQLATKHLIEQGCRRIAHIRGPQTSTGEGRLKGYLDTLKEHGRAPLANYVISSGVSGDDRGEPGGYAAAKELLRLKRLPDGIFCFNDPVAMGAMRAILEAGLDIPRDIAVIGCGNVPYCDLLRVPLSSVDQDSPSVGRAAAELALSLIHSEPPARRQTALIKPSVMIRASTLRKGIA